MEEAAAADLLEFFLSLHIFLEPEPEDPELPLPVGVEVVVAVALLPELVLVEEGVFEVVEVVEVESPLPGAAVSANLEIAGPGNW